MWMGRQQKKFDAVRAKSGPEEPKAPHEPKGKGLDGRLDQKPAYRGRSSKMGHQRHHKKDLVLQSYKIGRQVACAAHHACGQQSGYI